MLTKKNLIIGAVFMLASFASAQQHRLLPENFLDIGNTWHYRSSWTEIDGDQQTQNQCVETWKNIGTENVGGYDTTIQRGAIVTGKGGEVYYNYLSFLSDNLVAVKEVWDDGDCGTGTELYSDPQEYVPVFVDTADDPNLFCHGESTASNDCESWSGTVDGEITYLGMETITVSAGEFDCVKVRIRREWAIDDYEIETLWMHPEVGLIQQRSREWEGGVLVEKAEMELLGSDLLAGDMNVSAPAANELWARGSRHPIQWTTSDLSPDVRVLLLKGGVKVAVLKKSIDNDRGCPWMVPDNLALGNDYQIKVVCLESKTFGLSDPFEVCRPGDLYTPIEVTVPDSNSVWEMGSTYPVNWTGGDPGTDVKIKLFKGKNLVKTIAATAANDPNGGGQFDWQVPYSLATGTNYQVRVISNDYSYVKDASQRFEITAPPLNVTQPNGGQTWKSVTKHKIKWARGPAADHVKIILLNPDNTVKKVLTQSTPDDGVWTWKIPATLEPGQYKIRVKSLERAERIDVSDAVFDLVYNYDRNSYTLEELRRYDVRGEHWDYRSDVKLEIRGFGYPLDGYHYDTQYPEINVLNKFQWVDGHKCNIIKTTADGQTAKMAWFTDQSGSHIVNMVSNTTLGKMTIDMKAIVVAPKSLRIGTLYSNSGPASGTINGDFEGRSLSANFSGRSFVSAKLIRWENVTVPYGTFKAMKLKVETSVQDARINVSLEGVGSASANFSVKQIETAWAVPFLGMIKDNANQVIKISDSVDNMTLKTAVESVLRDHYNTR
jgi:5-hydroxyisourate hydrolase-like protein (transthyretin family)